MATLLKYMFAVFLILELVNCHPSIQFDRVRRQTGDKKKDLDDDEKGNNVIQGFSDILKGASESIRNIIAIKQQIGSDVLPIIQSFGETIQDIYKSGLVESGAKLARTTADNANNVVTTVVKAGEQTVPIVNQLSSTINSVSSPLIKIALCVLICPLQRDEDEKKQCEKDNCSRPK
jgi:hypothetical protein